MPTIIGVAEDTSWVVLGTGSDPVGPSGHIEVPGSLLQSLSTESWLGMMGKEEKYGFLEV